VAELGIVLLAAASTWWARSLAECPHTSRQDEL